jgi:protein-disulfide isomerase
MKRYALPIVILLAIALLIGLSFFGGSVTPNYTGGIITEPTIGEEWVIGNPNASVKLIEYSDFQCPACLAYQPLIKQVIANYGDKIAFVFRHYPLYQIHPNADLASRVAESAGLQGKFWQMHDMLFDGQRTWAGMLNPESVFEKYAVDLGLNLEKFKADINSDAVLKEVASDYQRGARIGVTGTPTFILNGIKMRNPDNFAGFQSAIDSALLIK